MSDNAVPFTRAEMQAARTALARSYNARVRRGMPKSARPSVWAIELGTMRGAIEKLDNAIAHHDAMRRDAESE